MHALDRVFVSLAIDRGPLRLVQQWVDQFDPFWGPEGESLDNHLTHMTKHQASIEETP